MAQADKGAPAVRPVATEPAEWWRRAVIYQVYIRSFADANGDGNGDIKGIIKHLDYLSDLGVDALWINPWFTSPQVDGGYDVADYRDIDPLYGTLKDADALIRAAHRRGLRVLLDLVPNHSSVAHPWFQAALAGDPTARARYYFWTGQAGGGEPPNDWISDFDGPAWEPVPGEPGLWYMHLFAKEQPDFNWNDEAVRHEFEEVQRFWFDRGVDGFRIDVAHSLVKAPGLPDVGTSEWRRQAAGTHPAKDQEGVHQVYRSWRTLAKSYQPERVLIGEVFASSPARRVRYTRADELHQTFAFDLMRSPWRAEWLRPIITEALVEAAAVGAPTTWVLSNHDDTRHLTRYARPQPDHLVQQDWDQGRWARVPADQAIGAARARAATLLVAALPGSLSLYQGEELGLPEVEFIPADRRMDPVFIGSHGMRLGRDGCRVPLPWDAGGPNYGFSGKFKSTATAPPAEPWLPQPTGWGDFAVGRQLAAPDSCLLLYRRVLALRRQLGTAEAELSWLETPPGVLAFEVGSVQVWVNTTDQVVALPSDADPLLASEPGWPAGQLGAYGAAWLPN